MMREMVSIQHSLASRRPSPAIQLQQTMSKSTRMHISREQHATLERISQGNLRPDREQRVQVADQLGLDLTTVTNWFYARRGHMSQSRKLSLLPTSASSSSSSLSKDASSPRKPLSRRQSTSNIPPSQPRTIYSHQLKTHKLLTRSMSTPAVLPISQPQTPPNIPRYSLLDYMPDTPPDSRSPDSPRMHLLRRHKTVGHGRKLEWACEKARGILSPSILGCDIQIEDSFSSHSSEEDSSAGLLSPVSSLDPDVMVVDSAEADSSRPWGKTSIPMIVVSPAIESTVHSQDEADVAAALMGMRNLKA
ncbi:hypothetical protein SISNIDRAFT_550950 [Sistotremastrum niveocremeum HHB9708]|uniref:Homeobox domain-containing protein n=1 Tax=Sistotremastrum niveocremeum HHB9708 TaxID=1314777 RepID=A0A164SQ39_9AGAM|nr:hypothetical protein SISNIDRAFT_550950 [Sistotremastrum niveocremeum HHB9708]